MVTSTSSEPTTHPEMKHAFTHIDTETVSFDIISCTRLHSDYSFINSKWLLLLITAVHK